MTCTPHLLGTGQAHRCLCLEGVTGASPGNCTLHLTLTKGAPRFLGLAGEWHPELDSNQRNAASEAACRSPAAGISGLDGRSRTYANNVRSVVPEFPRAVEIWLSRLDLHQHPESYEDPAPLLVLRDKIIASFAPVPQTFWARLLPPWVCLEAHLGTSTTLGIDRRSKGTTAPSLMNW